jgi:hypothetical protein
LTKRVIYVRLVNGMGVFNPVFIGKIFEGGKMHCEKCSGLMFYEGFYGWGSEAVWYYPGWRCVHCGDVIDSVISLNRRLNAAHQSKGHVHEKGSLLAGVGGEHNGHQEGEVLYFGGDDY